MSVFFQGKRWFEKCKLILLPVTEEKIKDFAHVFLIFSHLLSVLEGEDSAVLEQYFFLCMGNGGIKKV